MLNRILNRIIGTRRIVEEIEEVPPTISDFCEKQEKFIKILRFAKSIIETVVNIPKDRSNYKEHPLIDLVRLLGRGVQTEYLVHLTYSDADAKLSITPKSLLFGEYEVISTNGTTFRGIMKEVKSSKEINLSKDLILPCPWKRQRLVSS